MRKIPEESQTPEESKKYIDHVASGAELGKKVATAYIASVVPDQVTSPSKGMTESKSVNPSSEDGVGHLFTDSILQRASMPDASGLLKDPSHMEFIQALPIPTPRKIARTEGMSCIKCRKRQKSLDDLVICTEMRTSKRFKETPRPCVNKFCTRCAKAFNISPGNLHIRQWKCAVCTGAHVTRPKKKYKPKRAPVIVSNDLKSISGADVSAMDMHIIKFPGLNFQVDLNDKKVRNWIELNVHRDLNFAEEKRESSRSSSFIDQAVHLAKRVQLNANQELLNVPEHFICPMTKRIMSDPVLWIKDHNSYERYALDHHIQKEKQGTSVQDFLVFPTDAPYYPNNNLRKCIDVWKKKKTG